MEFVPSHCPFCGEELGEKHEEGRKRLYCQECDRIIWRNAEPVAAVIVKKGDKVLLLKRGIEPGKGLWSLPAGFLEVDETAEEAAVRELEEETGLRVDEGDLEFVETLNMERFQNQRLLANVFKVEVGEASGELDSGTDAVDAGFFDPRKLEETDMELRRHFRSALEKIVGEEL
jgi:8-oxo-dGTP diphosphatase